MFIWMIKVTIQSSCQHEFKQKGLVKAQVMNTGLHVWFINVKLQSFCHHEIKLNRKFW